MNEIWLEKASRVVIGENVCGGTVHMWRLVRGITRISPKTYRGSIMFKRTGMYVYAQEPMNEETVWQLYNPELVD